MTTIRDNVKKKTCDIQISKAGCIGMLKKNFNINLFEYVNNIDFLRPFISYYIEYNFKLIMSLDMDSKLLSKVSDVMNMEHGSELTERYKKKLIQKNMENVNQLNINLMLNSLAGNDICNLYYKFCMFLNDAKTFDDILLIFKGLDNIDYILEKSNSEIPILSICSKYDYIIYDKSNIKKEKLKKKMMFKYYWLVFSVDRKALYFF